MEKIKNIEILRIIGVFGIILFHFLRFKIFSTVPIFEHLDYVTRNAGKAVDLFFILSGFFFMLTYKKELSVSEFVMKKVIRLYPVLLFLQELQLLHLGQNLV